MKRHGVLFHAEQALLGLGTIVVVAVTICNLFNTSGTEKWILIATELFVICGAAIIVAFSKRGTMYAFSRVTFDEHGVALHVPFCKIKLIEWDECDKIDMAFFSTHGETDGFFKIIFYKKGCKTNCDFTKPQLPSLKEDLIFLIFTEFVWADMIQYAPARLYQQASLLRKKEDAKYMDFSFRQSILLTWLGVCLPFLVIVGIAGIYLGENWLICGMGFIIAPIAISAALLLRARRFEIRMTPNKLVCKNFQGQEHTYDYSELECKPLLGGRYFSVRTRKDGRRITTQEIMSDGVNTLIRRILYSNGDE